MNTKLKQLFSVIILIILVFALTSCSLADFIVRIVKDSKDNEKINKITKSIQQSETEYKLNSEKKLEHIPVEKLFAEPEFMNVVLAPDGKKIAYRYYNDETGDGIFIENFITGEITEAQFPENVYGNYFFDWTLDNKKLLFFIDNMGDENYRLYISNLETGETKELLAFEDVQVRFESQPRNNSDEIYISMNLGDSISHDLYKLNLITGEYEIIDKNPGNCTGWEFDEQGNMLIREMANEDGGTSLFAHSSLLNKSNEKDEFQEVIRWDYGDSQTSGLINIDTENSILLLIDSRNYNTARLVEYDLISGNIEVIAENPESDVVMAYIELDTYEVSAVCYQKERREWEIFNDTFKEHFDVLEKAYDGDIYMHGTSYDDTVWLLSYNSDVSSLLYCSYDTRTKEVEMLFYQNDILAPYKLAQTQPFEFAARDGLKINGYITFPVEQEKKNLPMIVNVHGGPWLRDVWGFSNENQWMANRGYISLQVNYRGSSGYGKKFLNAGDKEWGNKMHYDILDAVDWAVKEGYADPDNIAIFGGSYGGYEALCGAVFSSDIFACSVDLFGPSNLITFLNSIPSYWKTNLESFYRRVGDPIKDKEMLEQRSPINFVDDIKIPVLIAHGANDIRVKKEEAEQIVNALVEKGLEHEYYLYEGTGHGFNTAAVRNDFYNKCEEFLKRNMRN